MENEKSKTPETAGSTGASRKPLTPFTIETACTFINIMILVLSALIYCGGWQWLGAVGMACGLSYSFFLGLHEGNSNCAITTAILWAVMVFTAMKT